MLWLTKQLLAKIAELISSLVKVNRNSTKKKGLITNRKDALPAELLERRNEIATVAMGIDTNSDLFRSKSGLLNPLFYIIGNIISYYVKRGLCF